MTRIFISYRRIDTSGYTGRLFDRLEQHFGQDTVFMDVTGIEPGLDFYEVIEEAVGSCDILIAMIGPRWLTAADAQGRRRLDNPDDFVRLEISAALKRNIRVIPALVGGASMPYVTDLPDDLRLLTRRNALTIGDRFHPDVDRLIEVLEKVLAQATPPPVVQPPPVSKPKTTPKPTSKPKPSQKPETRDSVSKTPTPKPDPQPPPSTPKSVSDAPPTTQSPALQGLSISGLVTLVGIAAVLTIIVGIVIFSVSESGNESWVAVMSKGTDITEQEWRWASSREAPEDFVNEKLNEGFFISEIDFGNDSWVAVMSKGTGITEQEWRMGDEVPEDFVNEKLHENFYITSIE